MKRSFWGSARSSGEAVLCGRTSDWGRQFAAENPPTHDAVCGTTGQEPVRYKPYTVPFIMSGWAGQSSMGKTVQAEAKDSPGGSLS